jgi:hypothetical protein
MCVAKGVDGTQSAHVFAHAGEFVLVHGPPVRAGEGGGDEGEEGDEAQEDEGVMVHCDLLFRAWFLVFGFWVLVLLVLALDLLEILCRRKGSI